jgi:hypothetical protein
MKGDARRALQALVADAYDPSASNCISGEGFYPLIKFMLAHKPWSDLVDVTGAVNLLAAATRRFESANGSESQTSGFAPPRDIWIDTVTEDLLRYPRSYVTLIQLPSVDIPGGLDIALDGRTRLLRSTLVAPPSVFGPQSGLGLFSLWSNFGGRKGTGTDQGVVCLEIKARGHLDMSEGCSAANSALARAKQILQLLSLSSNITIDPQFMPDRRESQMLGYESEKATDIVRVEMSEQLRQGLGSCQYTPDNAAVGLLGQQGTPQDIILGALKPYLPLLSASSSNQEAIRILTGLEWAFDAAVERNETQALLNACIGIEAVLGKKQESALTERLADRCAYLLGRGAQDRDRIADSFRKIYDVRSAVVHGRSRRLEPAQRGMLNSARLLLRDVLRREAADFPVK